MVKLEYYVPDTHLDAVNQALFAAGGGRIGNYDSCCWTTAGTGQFRPLEGSAPYLGQHGDVERVAETKVEMVVDDALVGPVVEALLAAHPYETPAFQLLAVLPPA